MKTNDEKELPDLDLEIGDVVDFLGLVGTVLAININFFDKVQFDGGRIELFYRDGTCFRGQTTPALKLIEKKKKPRKAITLYRYTFVGDIHTHQTSWSSDENLKPDGVVVKVESKEVVIDE